MLIVCYYIHKALVLKKPSQKETKIFLRNHWRNDRNRVALQYAHLPTPPPKILFNQAFRICPVNYFAPHDEKDIATT